MRTHYPGIQQARLVLAMASDDENGCPPANQSQPGTRQLAAGSIEARSRRILVVDDNVDSAESLALLLSLMKSEVQIALDGPSAFEIVREFQPEIVLLDIGMPGMDGYEIARRLRQQPSMEKALLAAVTGYGEEDDRIRSRAAGFDHHLVKPVGVDALRKLLSLHDSHAGSEN